jgi:large subunit ribosomal protein L30
MSIKKKNAEAKAATKSKKSELTKRENSELAKIRIQYYRSTIACPDKHKEIVRALGLRKLNQIVERPDTPSMRGAVAKLPHLIRIIE